MADEPEVNAGRMGMEAPEGVMAGTKALARAKGGPSPEEMRRIAGGESDLLTQVAGMDGAAGFKEVVSYGETPMDVFTRTQFKNEDEARHFAVRLALQAKRLEDDPLWSDMPFVHMSPVSAAYWLEAVCLKSVGRRSMKEAVMVTVGMLAPDVWTRNAADAS